MRADSLRNYIDGSKTLAQIFRENNRPFGNYVLFDRIFTERLKNLCDTCFCYKNANNQEKEILKENYDERKKQ